MRMSFKIYYKYTNMDILRFVYCALTRSIRYIIIDFKCYYFINVFVKNIRFKHVIIIHKLCVQYKFI